MSELRRAWTAICAPFLALRLERRQSEQRWQETEPAWQDWLFAVRDERGDRPEQLAPEPPRRGRHRA